MFHDFAGRQGLELVFEQEWIAQYRYIGVFAILPQLREQLLGISCKVFAATLGVEIDVAERELPLHAKTCHGSLSSRSSIRRRSASAERGNIIVNELHLCRKRRRMIVSSLSNPSAKPRGNNLFLDTVADHLSSSHS